MYAPIGALTDLDLVPVTYDVAREAARIRAATDLRMPDALIVATARVSDADVLVTGDRSWRPRLKALLPELDILEIGRRSAATP
jgi:predicted nucleic acid-binding protein